MTSSLPPGGYGAPLIGDSLTMFRDPVTFARRRYQRYGEVSKTSFMGKKAVMLLSAEAHRLVLATEYRNFHWRDGYGVGVPVFGDALFMIDGELHDRQRKLMTPAFHHKHMGGYLALMNHAIDAHLSQWGSSGQRSFYDEARSLAFALAATLLVGIDDSVDYGQLKQLFADMIDGLASASVLMQLNLPFTMFHRSLAARRKLDPIIERIIDERRAHPTTDALGLLVSSRDDDGSTFTPEQLVAQAKVLIFAGYDSTATTASWLMAELLRHPESFERVRAEVSGDPDAPLTLEDLRQQPYLDAAIKETLRLHPQASIMMRGARESFEFQGYTIPGGWLVLLVPPFVHRQERYFADPDRFDPARFLPPRDEDTKNPYAWVGFGGGPRICLGTGIAQIELKALITRILRRYDLTLLPGQDFTPIYLPIDRPRGSVVIRYAKRARVHALAREEEAV